MACSFRSAAKSLALGLILAAAVPSVQAFAQDIKIYRDEIHQSQNRFEQIKITNSENTARYNSEISQITSWIDEALILIGKNETEKVRVLSMKISVYIDFLDASFERDKHLTAAMEAESQLKALKAEHGKLEAQVQQLEAEQQVLQSKLDSISKK